MCGIVGYIGDKQAQPIVLSSLKRLEYRGYDSCGVAISGDGIGIFKDAIRVEALTKVSPKFSGSTGIGHTRWATHGAPSKVNAHPHLDCHGSIAVVHNGIIENCQELRNQLEPRHKLVSQTDTEVIPHLIEDYIKNGISLEQAVIRVIKELRGSYALLVISLSEPDKIVAARQDSPLVIGLDNGRIFVASDALCFLEATDEVIFIEDGEVVVVAKDGVKFVNGDGQELEKKSSKMDWRWDDATRQGYDFFMLKEIMEQPQAIRCALMQDKNLIMEMAMDILRTKQLVLTACGTSRYAALIGRYVFSKLAGKFGDVMMASELQYFYDSIDKNTLVIAVSQSGETADVIQSVKKAKENGATIFSLVNVVGSTLARMSDKVVYLNCGPEIGVAATKSFTSELAIFYLLGFAMVNKFDEGVEKVRAIARLIEDNLRHNGKKLNTLAQKLKEKNDFYYIARGINFAIAGEGALKIKEIAYVHAEGMPAGELKHGTLALIEDGTPVVAICPSDYTFNETLSNVAETKARGAFAIGVCDRQESLFDECIKIPQVEEIFYPLVCILPLQLLAYHLAIAKGLDPDKPRNLAKSVTVR